MILIGTSGSTKCDWQLVNDKTPILTTSSKGINPFFHDEKVIAQHITESQELAPYIEQIDVVQTENRELRELPRGSRF